MKEKEHKINFKLKEVSEETDEGKMVGFGCGMKYVGDSEDGVTPGMAVTCIGALLKNVMHADDDFIEELIQSLGTKFVSKNATIVSAKNHEEAKKKAKEKRINTGMETATEAFSRMMQDERWLKVITGKTNIKLDSQNKHMLAWVSTALSVIAELEGTRSKQCKYMEDLFLEDVAGIADNEDEEDEED